MPVGRNVRWLRLRRHMTQAELAQKVRLRRRPVHRSYITHLERGDFDPPLSLVRSCAKALGVPPWMLMCELHESTRFWERYLSLSPVDKRRVQDLIRWCYERER